jgi:hypothetical protein
LGIALLGLIVSFLWWFTTRRTVRVIRTLTGHYMDNDNGVDDPVDGLVRGVYWETGSTLWRPNNVVGVVLPFTFALAWIAAAGLQVYLLCTSR